MKSKNCQKVVLKALGQILYGSNFIASDVIMVMKAIFHPIRTRNWMRILWISPDSQNMFKWLSFFLHYSSKNDKISNPLRYPVKCCSQRSDNFRMSLWNNHFSHKTNEEISKISALASKERSNQKNKDTLLY